MKPQRRNNPIRTAKSAIDPANARRYVRTSLSRKTGFCCGVCNPGVLPVGCQLFEGGTTGVHHDAARNFAGHDVHTSARTSESFRRFESGSHEPNHQSAQSAPVPTQCRRRANFRAALRVRAPNRYHKAWEIRGRRRRDVEEVKCEAGDVAFSNQERWGLRRGGKASGSDASGLSLSDGTNFDEI